MITCYWLSLSGINAAVDWTPPACRASEEEETSVPVVREEHESEKYTELSRSVTADHNALKTSEESTRSTKHS